MLGDQDIRREEGEKTRGGWKTREGWGGWSDGMKGGLESVDILLPEEERRVGS